MESQARVWHLPCCDRQRLSRWLLASQIASLPFKVFLPSVEIHQCSSADVGFVPGPAALAWAWATHLPINAWASEKASAFDRDRWAAWRGFLVVT